MHNMAEKDGHGKRLKNSLLTAASSPFSYEEATLLVPVTLSDEQNSNFVEKDVVGACGGEEIDLNDDDVGGSGVVSLEDAVSTTQIPLSQSSISSSNSGAFGISISNPSSMFSMLGFSSSADTSTVAPTTMMPKQETEIDKGQEGASMLSFHTSTPTLYTPQLFSVESGGVVQSQEISLPAAAPAGQAPPSGAQNSKVNSFRLGSQRPQYAKYPGLTGSSMPLQPQVDEQVTSSTTTATFSPVVPAPIMSILPSSEEAKAPLEPVPLRFPDNNFTDQVPIQSSGFTTATAFTAPSIVSFGNAYDYNSSPMGMGGDLVAQIQQKYYKPVKYHWFHRKDVDHKAVWKAFSYLDSNALEQAFIGNNSQLIPTDGGRFDVNVMERLKYPVYWEESPLEVRRCSWFYKGAMDSRYIPYDEEISVRIEHEYHEAMNSGVWNRRLEFPHGEAIIMYNANAVSHFCQAAAPDEWGNLPESQLRPRVVKRGVEEFEIEDGEPAQVDHLVFLVHGIGSICDLKRRTIVEAVDDFRQLSFQLKETHFKSSVDSEKIGRIEFLPVSWHKALHEDGGIDSKLKPITLKSIPKLRNFTNDTLLDILFYSSPVYAQTIVDTVGSELNRLFKLFNERNPSFNGLVALAGHSLGSLILFDLLAHQPHSKAQESVEQTELSKQNDSVGAHENENGVDEASKVVTFTVGLGTGQPFIKYPTLEFEPTSFFALGSPIGMFVTVRGIDRLGENFHFPTCPGFFNIFHPFDPVAYRIETLIDPNCDMRPVLIPHHKGRKRFHLELKETMQRVGADIKQKFIDSMKNTWNTVYHFARFTKGDNLEQEINRVIEGEFGNKSVETNSNGSEDVDHDFGLGKLNGGRRIDYVLQEAPLESFNEYLFALSSHVCYWESEDTMLMVMREIYSSMGIILEKEPSSEIQSSNNLPVPPAIRDNAQIQYQTASPLSRPPPTFSENSYHGTQPASLFHVTPAPESFPFGATNQENPVPPPPFFINSSATAAAASQAFTPPSPMNVPPSPIQPANSNNGKPTIIGARPVYSPEELQSLRGMDPTQPIAEGTAPIGPPPLTGFMRKF